jgi:S-adenosylmethionine decarboxylase
MSGRHLILDGFADAAKLRSAMFVRAFLERVVELAKMELVDLRVYELEARPAGPDGDFVDPGGVTGYAVLTTSHASIHTFPEAGRFKFDLYSCRDFPGGDLEEFVLRELGARAELKLNWVR